MKDAFDDLEIIDAERKPEILVNNLKQGNEFFEPSGCQTKRSFNRFSKRLLHCRRGDPMGQTVPKVVHQGGDFGWNEGRSRIRPALRGNLSWARGGRKLTGDSRYIYAFARVNPRLLDPPSLELAPPP